MFLFEVKELHKGGWGVCAPSFPLTLLSATAATNRFPERHSWCYFVLSAGRCSLYSGRTWMSQEPYWDRSCVHVLLFFFIDHLCLRRSHLINERRLGHRRKPSLGLCNLWVSWQRAESETPRECLPHALPSIREAFLSSTGQCALQYKWFLREKEKNKKRKLIKCLLADPFNTNNVTRSVATASAESPGQRQGHRPPCILTGMYLQRSQIPPKAESSQVPPNYFKVNSSWGNWAPPGKPFRNPWPFLLRMVTLLILHVL